MIDEWRRLDDGNAEQKSYNARARFPKLDTSRTVHSRAVYGAKDQCGFPVFHTVWVMLRFTEQDHMIGRSGTILLDKNNVYKHSVTSSPYDIVGPRQKDVEPYQLEVILISDDNDLTMHFDRQHGNWFKALAVVWHGDHYDRLGLLAVDAIVLEEALPPGPVWKEIVLG